MKTIIISLFLVFIGFRTSAFTNEKDLDAPVKEATVYLSGAMITHMASVVSNPGQTIYVLKNLSPFIDANTIKVSGSGNFTVLSVNHQINYIEKLERSEKAKFIAQQSDDINYRLEQLNTEVNILNTKKGLLEENNKLADKDKAIPIETYKLFVEYYSKTMEDIQLALLEKQRNIRNLQAKLKDLQNQQNEIMSQRPLETSEIRVGISCKTSVPIKINISYLIQNAGWTPSYDIRVNSLGENIILAYKASVHQQSGIDWNNVKLRLSNANPNQSSIAPVLNPYFVNQTNISSTDNYSNYSGTVAGRITDGSTGEPLPGVSVMVKGTNLGTITDMNGYYRIAVPTGYNKLSVSFVGYNQEEITVNGSICNLAIIPDVKQLDEVVVTGYGSVKKERAPGAAQKVKVRGISTLSPEVQKTEYQTTVDFEVDEQYSVKSDGKPINIEIAQYDIPSTFEYTAVPKIEKAAFLIGRATDWKELSLLTGEANLYFENAFIGKTLIDMNNFSDTLTLSLGRDRNVLINRKAVKDYSKNSLLGSSKTVSKIWELEVKNNKQETIHLKLNDQIPVLMKRL